MFDSFQSSQNDKQLPLLMHFLLYDYVKNSYVVFM